jgi:hypothetical protein
MAHDTYLSRLSSLVLVIITGIWSLVFHFTIFGMYLTCVEAVILILKHATFLCLSNLSPKSALTRAELDYQKANVNSIIQQYCTTSPQEHSVEQLELFAAFIMATDIGSFILASVEIISHHVSRAISVFSQNKCA